MGYGAIFCVCAIVEKCNFILVCFFRIAVSWELKGFKTSTTVLVTAIISHLG